MVNKHKKRLWKEARERYQNLFEDEKRWKKARKRYQNFTEEEKEKRCQYYQDDKNKLAEYRKNYYLKHKK